MNAARSLPPNIHPPHLREVYDLLARDMLRPPPGAAARARSDTPALLRGIIFGSDGRAMSPSHTRGRQGQIYRNWSASRC